MEAPAMGEKSLPRTYEGEAVMSAEAKKGRQSYVTSNLEIRLLTRWNGGPSKMRLLPSYEVLWIHVFDAICSSLKINFKQ